MAGRVQRHGDFPQLPAGDAGVSGHQMGASGRWKCRCEPAFQRRARGMQRKRQKAFHFSSLGAVIAVTAFILFWNNFTSIKAGIWKKKKKFCLKHISFWWSWQIHSGLWGTVTSRQREWQRETRDGTGCAKWRTLYSKGVYWQVRDGSVRKEGKRFSRTERMLLLDPQP